MGPGARPVHRQRGDDRRGRALPAGAAPSRVPRARRRGTARPGGHRRGVTRITLYGRPGCHLCEEARVAVEAVRADREIALDEVDVSLDPALERRYGERIPVVAIDDREALELRFGP